MPGRLYSGTSLIRNNPPSKPYSRTMLRALVGSWWGGRFVMGEVPLQVVELTLGVCRAGPVFTLLVPEYTWTVWYTPNPSPYSLHPTPYTPNPKPQTLRPTP
jgi:hypothetical protein